MTRISVVVTALTAILGIGLAVIMTMALVRPVKRLVAGTRAIEAGALDIEIPVTSSDEIGGLTTAFNRMVQELRSKARIRDTFGRDIDPRIVAGLIDRPELALEGDRRTMTVFFCDMKNFTALGEQLTSKNLVTLTNRCLTVMSEPVCEHGGIIDKFIGDAIMANRGPPFSEGASQAERACLAALDAVRRLPAFLEELPELTGIRRGLPEVGLRVGIATGPMLVGNIGSEVMKSYTVLGGAVNLAARLERANKRYGTRHPGIGGSRCDGERCHGAARNRYRRCGREIEPERTFEVMARKGTLDEQAQQLRARYAEALLAYRQRNWDAARMAVVAALDLELADGPSQTMLAHIDWWEANPPPPIWTGAWHLTEK